MLKSGKTLQSSKEITSKKNYKHFFLRFLRKCVGWSLVSARPLCSVNDASNWVFESSV